MLSVSLTKQELYQWGRASAPIFVEPQTSTSRERTYIELVTMELVPAERLIKWCIVWNDERWLSCLCDVFNSVYRPLRWLLYGRTADIEELHFRYDSKGSLSSIHFPGCYAGCRRYWQLSTDHYTRTVGKQLFEFDERSRSRPLIYVATWTHLMREWVPLDPPGGMTFRLHRDYVLYQNSRNELERFYSLSFCWKRNYWAYDTDDSLLFRSEAADAEQRRSDRTHLTVLLLLLATICLLIFWLLSCTCDMLLRWLTLSSAPKLNEV